MMNKFVLLSIVFFTTNAAIASNKIKNQCSGDTEFSTFPSEAELTPQLKRFYELPEIMEEAYINKKYTLAKLLANEYLDLAEIYTCNWNHGNAIHDGYRILGLVSLKHGNLSRAAWFLLDASETKGSVQLNSFGPNFDLANNLLRNGKQWEVISYLKSVESFWESDDGKIANWIAEIEQGKIPHLTKNADARNRLYFSNR